MTNQWQCSKVWEKYSLKYRVYWGYSVLLLNFLCVCLHGNGGARVWMCVFNVINSNYFLKYLFCLILFRRIQAKYLTTKYYGGVDFFTYLSICEFYVDNRINYNNPCETGSMVCFLNGSNLIAGDRIINEFDRSDAFIMFNNVGDVKWCMFISNCFFMVKMCL